MRKLTTMVGAALLATTLTAGANEGLYLGPSVSHYLLDKERSVTNDSENSTVLGLNLGYRFAGPWGVELGYGSDVGGEDLDVIKLDALYFLEARNGWAPYFVAGFSDFDRDDALLPDEDSTQQLGAGFGLSKSWGGHWEFRGDGRFLHKLSSGADATDLAFNLGLNYYFSAPAAEPAPVVAEPEPQPAPPPATRTITVELKVLFEFDKAEVRSIYGDELEAVAKAMKQHDDIDLVLEGHTDSVGTDAYNQDLSQRRVDAVKAKLVEMYGIPGNRISTVGYGESRPVADNSTDEGRAKNRRVIGAMTFEEVVGN
ncbi:MAG: OmpA family protein [Porticoccaceae bacterium]